MISEKDKIKILEIAKIFNPSRVLLFGSSIDPLKEGSDIDIAVEGIPDSLFFKFYAELIFNLSKPVDLIDLKQNSRFIKIILSEGLLLYG